MGVDEVISIRDDDSSSGVDDDYSDDSADADDDDFSTTMMKIPAKSQTQDTTSVGSVSPSLNTQPTLSSASKHNATKRGKEGTFPSISGTITTISTTINGNDKKRKVSMSPLAGEAASKLDFPVVAKSVSTLTTATALSSTAIDNKEKKVAGILKSDIKASHKKNSDVDKVQKAAKDVKEQERQETTKDIPVRKTKALRVDLFADSDTDSEEDSMSNFMKNHSAKANKKDAVEPVKESKGVPTLGGVLASLPDTKKVIKTVATATSTNIPTETKRDHKSGKQTIVNNKTVSNISASSANDPSDGGSKVEWVEAAFLSPVAPSKGNAKTGNASTNKNTMTEKPKPIAKKGKTKKPKIGKVDKDVSSEKTSLTLETATSDSKAVTKKTKKRKTLDAEDAAENDVLAGDSKPDPPKKKKSNTSESKTVKKNVGASSEEECEDSSAVQTSTDVVETKKTKKSTKANKTKSKVPAIEESTSNSKELTLPKDNKSKTLQSPASKTKDAKKAPASKSDFEKSAIAIAKPKSKKRRFDQQILHHMVTTMKPFSTRILAQELKTTEQQLQFALLGLKDKGLVIEKEFTSSKGRAKTLIWADLENKSKDAIQIDYSVEKANAAKLELELLTKEEKSLQQLLTSTTDVPSNEALKAKVAAEEEQVSQLRKTVDEIKTRIKAAEGVTSKSASTLAFQHNQPNPSSAAQLARARCPKRMKMRIKAMRQHWKTRKEKCKDCVDMIADAMEKKPKEVYALLDIQTDEMESVTMPPKHQIDP